MKASPKVLRKKLQIAQNKVIRFINSLGPRTRITADILSELNLLHVETRVKQLRLNNVQTFFYNLCPQYLKENFVPLNDVHQYNTRGNRHNFLVPHCRSVFSLPLFFSFFSFLFFSFFFFCPHLLPHRTPLHIVYLHSLQSYL